MTATQCDREAPSGDSEYGALCSTIRSVGSVLVDIPIDQCGCFEDSHATTHADPTYQVDNTTFYCVANMPGAVPDTSTYAFTNAACRVGSS